MADSPDCARLVAAHNQIPEFAERTDYDPRRQYESVRENGLWWAALSDAGPAPYAAFVAAYERRGAFHLWLLGVRPDMRRNGLAATLLRCYLAEGRRRGHVVFTAHAHSTATGFARLLESAGFSQNSLGLEVVEVSGVSHARELLAFTLRN